MGGAGSWRGPRRGAGATPWRPASALLCVCLLCAMAVQPSLWLWRRAVCFWCELQRICATRPRQQMRKQLRIQLRRAKLSTKNRVFVARVIAPKASKPPLPLLLAPHSSTCTLFRRRRSTITRPSLDDPPCRTVLTALPTAGPASPADDSGPPTAPPHAAPARPRPFTRAKAAPPTKSPLAQAAPRDRRPKRRPAGGAEFAVRDDCGTSHR